MIFKKNLEKFFSQHPASVKDVFSLFCFIFVFWTSYRYFPEALPAWIEELILKPLIWLMPTLLLVKKRERQSLSSLGFNKKNFFTSLYWGIGLGIIFLFEGLIANFFKYRGWNFEGFQVSPSVFFGGLFLSFATALSEETVFRGYIFSRLWQIWKNEPMANLFSSFLFSLIHLPIAVLVLGYTPVVMITYLFLVFAYGVASAFVFARSKNIVSSFLLHVFWSWPVILFK